ncbi:hypothetical protein EJE24_09825 [Enterobacter huaxiensis]|uniref:MotA/TolQ/ExbB proton channel domain-containing protein n=1 Tax=Enterobacter huaxiensis TaxID=2494702 RepID=A0A428LTN1_9ENTR|nr:hypothetical protein [Enterobacter huaxiensis]RSK68041.1 hypothetical protein EJE24_09825 [Enterobacter huaxiensis]
MNLALEIFHFLVPGFDALQMTFFAVMLLAVIYTWISVRRHAQETEWQQAWERSGLQAAKPGVSAELGSAAELSQSLATKAEKMAAIMPGMLLILGLLGTFLGLGLALDKASSILHNSGNSIGAMDSSMRDLMEMMQGLGTKFKTSTWGIIAFIVLKVWESKNGYEERRLNWCMAKLQQTLTEEHALQTEENASRQQQREAGRHAATERLVEAMALQTAALREEFRQQATRSEEQEAQRHQYHLAALNEIADINNQSRNLLETYTRKSEENLAALQQAATTMSDASQQVSGSAVSLESVVSTLGRDLGEVMTEIKRELSQVVNDMNTDFTRNVQQMSDKLADSTLQLSTTMGQIETSLNDAITSMNASFSGNMTQMADKLESATSQISESVNNMSSQIDSTMSTVKKSTEAAASIQRNAMEEFKETSEVLNEKVIAMTTYIQRVTKEISSGLAAVSEGNRKMEFYIKRFSDAFDLLGALPDNVNRLTHEVSELCVRIDRQMSVQQPVEELVEA